MKRIKIRRLIFVLLLATCALGAVRTNKSKPANEPPRNAENQHKNPMNAQSVEELFENPLFNAPDDASEKETLDAALRLSIAVKAYNENIARDPERINGKTREQIDAEQRENLDKYNKRFEEVFVPKLKSILANDENANSDDATVNALRAYLDYLCGASKFNEIAELHEIALKRDKEAQLSGNDALKNRARRRLILVDQHYLSVRKMPDVVPFLSGPLNRVFPEPTYSAIIESGNKIVDEIERDPLLVGGLADCYRLLVNYGYDEEALDLREKLFKKIDFKTAERAMYESGTGDPKTSPLFVEGRFDESILDNIPENESKEFYQELRRKIQIAVQKYRNVRTTKNRRDEINGKAQIAFMRLSDLLGEPIVKEFAFKRRDVLVPDFYEVKYATLTPQSAAFLRKAIDDESAKPFDELRVQFVDYARVALLSYELDEAFRSNDQTAIAAACERFIERADESSDAAERLLRDAQKYARSNPDVAEALLERVLDKAEKSNGKLAADLENFRKLKESLDKRTP